MEKTFYFRRLLARSIDFTLVILMVRMIQAALPGVVLNSLGAYLLYNVVVIALGGMSLGKYTLMLKVKTDRKGLNRFLWLSFREILLFPILPILAINAVNTIPIPLHDQLTGTQVVHDIK